MSIERNEGVVVVIDPYSSGRFLVEELHRRGKKIVSLRSTLDVTACLLEGYDSDAYHGSYDVPADEPPAQTAEYLTQTYGKIEAVFAGSEPGVILTDALNHVFGFKWNDHTTSELRRNKALQQDRLRECGLRAVKQLYSNDIQEMLQFRRDHLEWPVVIKPPLSAGTDGVYFCSNEQEVIEACEANFGRMDILGNVCDKVLIQEFLHGLEYVVDTMSRDGEHVLAAIWVYAKSCNLENGSITYDNTQLLQATGEIQEQLIDYIISKGGVLDALGIHHGPAHAEIMMTPTGPCLVEVANRMHGCDGPKTAEICTGFGQHQLYADIVFDGHLFDKYQREQRYTLHKKAICLTLTNLTKEGRLLRDVDCPELRKACTRSVVEISGMKKGELLVPTRCLLSSPGEVLLIHPDPTVVLEDADAIRALEATGFLYQVEGDELDMHGPKPSDARSDTQTGTTMSPIASANLLSSPSSCDRNQ